MKFSLRHAVLIAIALVSVWLMQLWQDEHASKTEAQGVESIPVQSTTVETTATKIPTTQPTPGAQNKPLPHSMISVQTDVETIIIDPLGGNIVNNKLTSYAETNQPNSPPYELFSTNPENYYVAESGLVSAMGPDQLKQQALYTTSKQNYILEPNEKQLIVPLTYRTKQGVEITKTFTFTRGSYTIEEAYHIKNNSSQVWSGQSYWQLKRAEPESKSALMSLSTFTGAAYSTEEEPYEKLKFSAIKKEQLDKITRGGWVAMMQHYFVSAFIPEEKENSHFYSLYEGHKLYTIGTLSPIYQVQPGEEKVISAKLYSGPLITDDLKKVAKNLDLTVDYGWLWYISAVLFWMMKFIHQYIGNWGWTIVILTLLIKIMLYAPSAMTYRSAIKMRTLGPKIAALKEKYANDRAGMHQAIAEMYKTEKINPFGGCLPLLLQLPFFIALYWVIIESVELRHAPFVGWITDLSSKDPYYVLPALMLVTMFIQQKLSPPPADPVQAKVMLFMPVFFSALFINFPAGLLIYWVVNNTVSILQQWYVNKTHPVTS